FILNSCIFPFKFINFCYSLYIKFFQVSGISFSYISKADPSINYFKSKLLSYSFISTSSFFIYFCSFLSTLALLIHSYFIKYSHQQKQHPSSADPVQQNLLSAAQTQSLIQIQSSQYIFYSHFEQGGGIRVNILNMESLNLSIDLSYISISYNIIVTAKFTSISWFYSIIIQSQFKQLDKYQAVWIKQSFKTSLFY
ncbi:hypothetical protein IMG5_186190, partial [Ichthyophthirius multifiliis]